MRALLNASPEEQRRIIWSMSAADVLALDADFEAWAHEAQLPPKQEGWRTWLMMAGRGFGKTRAGAEWVEKIARSRPGVRIALVGATIDEARRVMVEGVSGVLSVAKRQRHRVKWEPSIGRLKWPNGSEAQLFSGDNPDGLRGPEHDFAWGAAAIGYRCCRVRRGTAGRRSAFSSATGRGLSCRRCAYRDVDRPCRQSCWLRHCGLAVHRADDRNVGIRQELAERRHLFRRGLGGRQNSGGEPDYRWRPSGWPKGGVSCRPFRWINPRC